MTRHSFLWLVLLPLVTVLPVAAQGPESVSLEDLLNTEISTASKYEQTAREAPASVTIVTAEEIDRFGYRTLQEVLQNVRGFYVSDDRNYGYLGVRGFSRPADFNSRILMQVDGHTMNENFYGSMSVGADFAFDLESVERIEIVRGPGSALYGTGAMFAVVNVVTREGASAGGLSVTVESGSLGRAHTSLRYGKRFTNGWDLSLSGVLGDIDGEDIYFEEFDDPSTNDGVAENRDFEKYSGAHLSLQRGNFRFQGLFSTRDKGIPTSSFETNFNDPRSVTTDEWTLLEASYDWKLGPDKKMTVRGYWNDYFYDGTYPYEDDYLWWDENASNWWGTEAQFTWDPRTSNRLVLGAEYQDHYRAAYYAWDSDDWVYFDDDIPFDVLSFYLQDSYQVTQDLSVTVGLRHDDYSDVGSTTNPRFALVYHPTPGGTLKALYGEAFRRPNHYEVYYEDGDYNKANPDLEPEEIRTTELIWEQRLGKYLYGSVSVYNYEMENLITGIADPEDELVQFQNLDRVEAGGFELELTGRLPNGTSAYASYGYQETVDQTTDLQLTNSPQHLFRTGLSVPVHDYLVTSVQARYESERTTVWETELDSYLVVDLHATTRFPNDFRLSLHVLNLLDEEYSTPGGFEHVQDGIVQQGRNVRVSVGYNF